MLEKVYDHIIMDIKQNTRTDTIFIIVAIVLNLISLGVGSGMANERSQASTWTMVTMIVLVIVVNIVVIFGLLRGRDTRNKLITGLMKMYKDEDVEGYYDSGIVSNYDTRYLLFILAVVTTGITAIVIPLILKFMD
jgi:F0F1-type ATP synthase membrane subunit c/vacuolar-type H+-ATPase subunit K